MTRTCLRSVACTRSRDCAQSCELKSHSCSLSAESLTDGEKSAAPRLFAHEFLGKSVLSLRREITHCRHSPSDTLKQTAGPARCGVTSAGRESARELLSRRETRYKNESTAQLYDSGLMCELVKG